MLYLGISGIVTIELKIDILNIIFVGLRETQKWHRKVDLLSWVSEHTWEIPRWNESLSACIPILRFHITLATYLQNLNSAVHHQALFVSFFSS